MTGPRTPRPRRARALWGLALALPVAACAASAAPRPVLVAGPGQSLERLEAGRGLYTNHCQGCHALPDPGQLQPTAWPARVAEMSHKSGLSGPQVTLVSDYLVAASRAARERPALLATASASDPK